MVPGRSYLVGFGLANRAVARALLRRGLTVRVSDDAPSDETMAAAAELGLELVVGPEADAIDALVAEVDAVIPAPGVPDAHPVFEIADRRGCPVLTEFDLAQEWDGRPVAAITGTDGKTTVTNLVADILREAGIRCVEAGNNDLPLVAAIDDPVPEWFVVEASSFRLGRTHGWAPDVATWLNFAPDHLDVHQGTDAYEAAKARIWTEQRPGGIAIGNLDDPVVASHLGRAPARRVGFSLHAPDAAFRVVDGVIVGPSGPILPVADLPRQLPHDVSNALAAAATADAVGADVEMVATVLRRATPLPHRVELVAEVDGVAYYDDSKATVPHATLAAVRGFDSVVLVAGGRNKGLDLGVLADAADHIRAVVAIGEAATEVAAAFDGVRPVRTASSMAEAVEAAGDLAVEGDVVVLSPACASFDWYPGYAARGDDFAALVRARGEQT